MLHTPYIVHTQCLILHTTNPASLLCGVICSAQIAEQTGWLAVGRLIKTNKTLIKNGIPIQGLGLVSILGSFKKIAKNKANLRYLAVIVLTNRSSYFAPLSAALKNNTDE
jgi:hypothetical protein